MLVLIFEPDHSGHHLTYVRMLADALLGVPCEIVVCLDRDAPGTLEYKHQLSQLASRIRIEPVLEPLRGGPLKTANTRLRQLFDSIRSSAARHIYVPYADGLAQVWGVNRWLGRFGLPRGVEIEGLMMRGKYVYAPPGRSTRLKASLALKSLEAVPWTVLHHLDPLPFNEIQRRGGKLAARSRLMPDPVEPPPHNDRCRARRDLGVPEGGRYIVAAGMLDERKGTDLLIRAFENARLAPDDRLLLAGRLSRAVADILANSHKLLESGRVIAPDRFLSDAELMNSFIAADLVCTPYRRHIGSASILLRAVAANRPVLASNFGWMGYVTNTFQLGRTVDPFSMDDFPVALRDSLDAAARFELSDAARQFRAFHTIENFQTSWTMRLRQRLHLPVNNLVQDFNATLDTKRQHYTTRQ